MAPPEKKIGIKVNGKTGESKKSAASGVVRQETLKARDATIREKTTSKSPPKSKSTSKKK